MIDIQMQHRITEEDTHYYTWVFGVLQHLDPDAELMIRENEKQLIVHITPKDEEVRKDIIANLLNIHRNFGVQIEFSKSLGISKKISYFINKLTKEQEKYFVSLQYGK